MASKKKLKITLIKSPIGYKKDIRETVHALGLKKMHQTVIKEDNATIRGMIKKVQFMLNVEEES